MTMNPINRLLIISDSEAHRELLYSFLTPHFACETAASTAEAEDILYALNDPAQVILVTDYLLNEGSIEPFLRRELGSNRLAGVLVVSGHPEVDRELAEVCETYRSRGIDFGFLSKPFKMNILRSALKAIAENISLVEAIQIVRPKYELLYAHHPERIIRAAIQTLAITIPELISTAKKLNLPLSEEDLQKVASESTGTQDFPVSTWTSLCQILDIEEDCIAYGYSWRHHVYRVRASVQENRYPLEIKPSLLNQFESLSRIEAQEHCWDSWTIAR